MKTDRAPDSPALRRSRVLSNRTNLIREAIDAFLQGSKEDGNSLLRFRAALEEVEESPVTLPDGRQYVEDLRRRDLARQEELERRGRA